MQISFILPALVASVGVYLLIKLRFFFILHPLKTAREFLLAIRDRDVRRSFFLALSGTLGVGNIFGVSAGILIGGEGSLFWLFVSSIFSAVIKYAEVLLVFDVDNDRRGMAGVLDRVFGKRFCKISQVYALLTVALSLSMGSAMQASAVCDVADKSIGLRWPFVVFILVLFLFPALIGGAKKIENITEIIIPLTTIIYISMCLWVTFVNFAKLPSVVNRVISQAIVPESLAGGTIALAIKEGFARGIVSNEAGTGTSALAHSRSSGRSPHIAGLFGMCEVIFDTTVLCTLTGLVILVSVPDFSTFSTPMSLIFAAFYSSMGEVGILLLPLVFFFAYATIICWYYYGMEYCGIYFGKVKGIFPLFFILAAVISGFLPSESLLYLTDLIVLFMTFLTLSAMIVRADRIAFLSAKNPER